MDLRPAAVVLQSCAQPGPLGGRIETVGRQGWMKPAGAFLGRPRELRTRHNMAHDIGGLSEKASPFCALPRLHGTKTPRNHSLYDGSET